MMMKKTDRSLPFWRNPRFRYGSLSTALLCVFLALIVALNMLMTSLETKNGWRVDMSFNALTTTSETTKAMLDALEHPVHIYALFSKGQEDLPLMELLNRYAALSDKVTWEQDDVSLNPGLLTKFDGAESDDSITNDSLIVWCEATGRWRVVNWMDFLSVSFNIETGSYEYDGLTYERQLTSAISYVAQTNIPRIMVLQDHGELSESHLLPSIELFENNHYEVQFFSFNDGTAVLSPDDLLMILSPVRDLMDAELAAIMEFMNGGGDIFFTVDFTNRIDQMPNYATLLRAYGFVPMDGLVVASAEEKGTYYENIRINLIPAMQSTEATYDLIASNTDTLLLTGSRAFEMPTEEDQYLVVSPVLLSGAKSYLREMTSTSTSIEKQEGDLTGPFALALQSMRFSETGEVSRGFALGCSSIMTSSQLFSMTDTQEFLIRMTEHLSGSAPIGLDIMAKTAVRPQLTVESVGLGSMILVSLPMAVVAAALIVLIPRRRR